MIRAGRIKGCCVALSLLLAAACHSASEPRAAQRAPDASLSSDAGTDADSPQDTARALATLEPTAAAESGEGASHAVLGRAELWEHGKAVTLKLDIRACKPSAKYQARVHAGGDCSERTLAAEAWSAGEGIDVFSCTPSGTLITHYARRPEHEQPWTIGGSSATDLVGHALTLSDVATGLPMTCGVVERAPDALFSETTDTEGPTVQIRGAVAGVCIFDRQVPEIRQDCPDYAAATACASTYCELNRCIDSCATYVQCLAQARGVDICMAAYTCEPSEDCTSCQSDVVRCEVDVCLDKLLCAEPPRPDGPCSKLQQCCSMNEADPAFCLDFTKDIARFGDDQCQLLLDDWTRRGKPCPVD